MKLTVLNWFVFPAMGLVWSMTVPIFNHFYCADMPIEHVTEMMDPQDWDSDTYQMINFIGLAENYGYTAEEYKVTTKDGYILTLHRISGSPSSPKAPGKPAVYLQHGILLSSDSWILMGPEKDLAFLLADQGKDVWLGNTRGNTYSRAHVKLDPAEEQFWEFSYHEMGIYDLPAIIDTILDMTDSQKLEYYGYSMGTTISYVLLSQRPEYNQKISKMYHIAPVAKWGSTLKSMLKVMDVIFDALKEFITFFKFQQLLPQSAMAAELGKKQCDESSFFQPICFTLFSTIGLDKSRFNQTLLPHVMKHFPAGVSKYTVYHYNQNYNTHKFAAYDYGVGINLKKYGTAKPPKYDLSKVKVPVTIWYADNDDIAYPDNVFSLAKELPNVIDVNKVDDPKFNHFDFLWATDVRQLVYNKL
ncbi:lipase 3-like [Trichogramma pretiosum]|uniref:lipase 3-like n=1 Tax=Trichogramma pretiosum TaxID=7493 RepID=UPI0006C9A99E|nr:lipase 3-like [Trichogramma pretiosum]